jgi:hypothetical protein
MASALWSSPVPRAFFEPAVPSNAPYIIIPQARSDSEAAWE